MSRDSVTPSPSHQQTQLNDVSSYDMIPSTASSAGIPTPRRRYKHCSIARSKNRSVVPTPRIFGCVQCIRAVNFNAPGTFSQCSICNLWVHFKCGRRTLRGDCIPHTSISNSNSNEINEENALIQNPATPICENSNRNTISTPTLLLSFLCIDCFNTENSEQPITAISDNKRKKRRKSEYRWN